MPPYRYGRTEPDTITIPRTEHERLKDCERVLWTFMRYYRWFQSGNFGTAMPRISGGFDEDEDDFFMLAGDSECHFGGIEDVSPLEDKARAIIDAAMRAESEGRA